MRQLVKRLLPSRMVQTIKSARAWLQLSTLKLMASRRFLSKWYVHLKGDSFSRENHTVLAGMYRHRQYAKTELGADSHPRLRRNTHRLEKGLLMRPRKSVFALAYIEQLVDDYLVQLSSSNANQAELQWAHNVLAEYFSVVDVSSPLLKGLRQRFLASEQHIAGSGHFKPYLRGQLKSDVSLEQLKQLSLQRRSVRWFTDQPVDRRLIEEACEVASLSPSACNRQPFRIVVVDDPSKKQKAAALPMGTGGWAENIPVFVVFVGDFSSFEFARDRHVPYIDASLAAMTFMLALETLGLSSCPINWPDIEPREKAMAKLLSLESWERPIMCMAIGYADATGSIAFSQKKQPQQLIQYL